MKKCFILFLAILLSACAAATRLDNYSSLGNQGILPLSTSNPYMGANLFLANEIEQSSYLHNFLRAKGAPTAIDILTENFRQPRMLLFYPRDREVYAADLFAKGDQRQWIIRGPYGIERKDYSTLARMETALIGEPVFVLQGREYRFHQAARHDYEASQVASRPEVRPALPAPERRETVRPAAPARRPASPPAAAAAVQTPAAVTQPRESLLPADPREFRPRNRDQVAIIISKGWAERNADGDVIHIVRRSDETASTLARWYGGSEDKAGAISSANSVPVDEKLVPGSRIRIPLALATNFKPMPLDYR